MNASKKVKFGSRIRREKVEGQEEEYLKFNELPEDIKQAFWEGFDPNTLYNPISSVVNDDDLRKEDIDVAIDNSWEFDTETVAKSIVDEKGIYSILGDMLILVGEKKYFVSIVVDIPKDLKWSEENVEVILLEQ